MTSQLTPKHTLSDIELDLDEIEGMVNDVREQFQFKVIIPSRAVAFRSLHGGGVILGTLALRWLEEHIGQREEGSWTWFGTVPSENLSNNTYLEFGFKSESDAVHFKLAWLNNE